MFAKKYDAGVSSILTCKRKVENNQEQSKPIYHYVAKPPPPQKKKPSLSREPYRVASMHQKQTLARYMCSKPYSTCRKKRRICARVITSKIKKKLEGHALE
jgi:hypothetical protein